MMKRLLKRWKLLAGLMLVAVLLTMAFWPQPALIDVARVARGGLTITIDEEGETRVRQRFVVSAPVTGRVQRISLEPGDTVRADRTTVATFTPADPIPLDVRSRAEAEAAVRAAEASVGRARAERERAAATERQSRSDLERMRPLLQVGALSQQTFQSAQTQVQTAEEAVRAAEFAIAAAEQELAMAQARLSSVTGRSNPQVEPIIVRSPVDGVVLRRLRESEAVVPAGEPLVEIGDPRQLEIVADFLSADAVRIRAGQQVIVDRWGGDDEIKGRVRLVEPSGFTKISALGVEEQRVNVIISFVDPLDAWRRLGHAFRVQVRVVVWEQENVLRTPTSSLFRRGDGWAVFTVSAGLAKLRTVQIGWRNGSEAQVLSGLSEGETVIVHPSDAIQDGGPVAIRSGER
jgi:HlyD family secretion protein